MIKHIVLWKLKEGSEPEAPQTIKRLLEALDGKIPGMLRIEVGINILPGDYDVALYSEFTDAGALAGYQIHPEHLAAKAYIGSVTSSRAAADYEGS